MFAWLWHALLVACYGFRMGIGFGAGYGCGCGFGCGWRVFRLCDQRPWMDSSLSAAITVDLECFLSSTSRYDNGWHVFPRPSHRIQFAWFYFLRQVTFFGQARRCRGEGCPSWSFDSRAKLFPFWLCSLAASGLWFLSMPLQLQLKCAIGFDFSHFWQVLQAHCTTLLGQKNKKRKT